MSAARVLFCHGLESGPHGYKYRSLVAAGYDVRAPDCRGQQLAARVELLTELLVDPATRARELVVVGSSYGGIAGLLAVLEAHARGACVRGLVLCAPALMRQLRPDAARGVTLRAPVPTICIHGVHDEIIPIALSREFATRRDHLAPVRLVEVDDDHGLGRSHPQILAAVAELHGSAPG